MVQKPTIVTTGTDVASAVIHSLSRELYAAIKAELPAYILPDLCRAVADLAAADAIGQPTDGGPVE